MNMNIIVTGGAGFIGSHLVDRLINDGHYVTVIDNLSTGYAENVNPKAIFAEEDLSWSAWKWRRYFKGQDIVFHVAAVPRIQPSIMDPLLVNTNNITATLNVLLTARDNNIKRVIYSASSSCYGTNKPPLREEDPPICLNPYALSKYVGEQYCKLFSTLYGLDTVSLRYFNVYGPRMDDQGDYSTVIGTFLRQKREGKPLTVVGDGEQRRDFTYVDDVVEANILAMLGNKKRFNGKVINIGTGYNYSINEIAKFIGGDTINLPPRPGEARVTLACNNRAQDMLDWYPKVKLQDGIKKVEEWHNEQ